MDSIDKVLSDLKEEYGNSNPELENTSHVQKSHVQKSHIQKSHIHKSHIQELSAKTSQKRSHSDNASDNASDKIYQSSSGSVHGNSIDRLLWEVKDDFQQQDLALELQEQQELEQKRLQEEKVKNQRRNNLKIQAEEWLKNLDKLSPEGLWFEEFAQGYPSRLEAAIDYLQVNQ
ncbi:MAG: salt stress protein, Slr1339 family [Mastigocoleus sp.]